MALSAALASCTTAPQNADSTTGDEQGESGTNEVGSESGGPEYQPPASPWIDSDREHLVDEAGRIRLFRGVNARVEGVFDVTFDDGRERLEPIPDFGPEDAAAIRAMGFNVLRLPINWSGVEPQRDEFDDAYLDAVEAVVDICKAEGIYVMIDFHQDAYSKEIGEDGAPLWAIEPPPDPEDLHEGPLTVEDLEAARTSIPVILAFLSFFADDDDNPIDQELQAEFRDMAKYVAARFADEAWVIGYEMFNEPVAEDRYLKPFHTKLAEAIREVDDRHLLFFEPNAIRNFTDTAPLSTSDFADARGVYAPHLYTLIFTDPDDELANLEKERLRENFDNAAAEAAAWATPLFIGEWGIGPDMPNAENYTRYMYELLDEHFLSSTNWVWKENSQGFWGFYDYDEAGDSWAAREQVVAWHDRAYAVAVGGTPTSMSYDPDAKSFQLEYEGREDAAPCEVYVPQSMAANLEVSCDGTSVDATRDESTGRVEVSCGAAGTHSLVITGN
jgi:endoglycosylceramidase